VRANRSVRAPRDDASCNLAAAVKAPSLLCRTCDYAGLDFVPRVVSRLKHAAALD
jgi:hypothetical protein